MNARYAIGIDLGTTNSVVAYASLESPADIELLMIPQVVAAGQVESRSSLPSFLYLPREGEWDSLRSPWGHDASLGVVGAFARDQAADNPQRVVAAAKSWLCHAVASRDDAVLPWQSPTEIPKVSAYECTQRFLAHLVAAWNHARSDAPLSDQQVVLTVPASFAPAARELTRQAAIEAGLPPNFVLLEEPQAAVYHWLAVQGERWRDSLKPEDVLLVIDVGGGTTDLTLITVSQQEGELELHRLAVGNHVLLGGDNMDLALAHFVSQRFAQQGHELDPWQSISLWHACRAAKEQLLAADGPEKQTISVLGRGSSLIASTVSTELSKQETRDLIVDGFFPECAVTDRPQRQLASGFQDIGLPYESDAAITKQVAAFLTNQVPEDAGTAVSPTHVLFNGGVFRSDALRGRMQSMLDQWSETKPKVLGQPADLDVAVAKGAAYYGWSKHHGGVRIRGGTARSYYIGIETAGLAIPGVPRPLRALCVAPQGMEEGSEAEVWGDPVGVMVGKPATFRFFASSVRNTDTVGTRLDRWSPDELVETQPITVCLSCETETGEAFLPVRFVSRVTELGMFELWCHSTTTEDKWKMEFNSREPE